MVFKIVLLVEMLKCGFEKLNEVLDLYEYSVLNLLSCMILDVEDIYLVVYYKDLFCIVLDYVRNFGSVVKEGFKRTIYWAAYYFINLKLWYFVSERVMVFLVMLVM